jgi:hypothetical protein
MNNKPTYKYVACVRTVGAAIRFGSRVQAEVASEMRCHPGSEGAVRTLVGLLHQVHCVVSAGKHVNLTQFIFYN